MAAVVADDRAAQLGSASEVQFADLPSASLTVDCLYRGGHAGHSGDDPIGKLLPVGNQGGIRYQGKSDDPRLIVLYTSLTDADWPDRLDPETGRFTYYGDNKKPGKELHDTSRKGNLILRNMFDAVHDEPPRRREVPPVLIFSKGRIGRDTVFRGLAAPGGAGVRPTDDLVGIWKTKDGARFQNYRALFSVLDVATISRAWVNDVLAGMPLSVNAPAAWKYWLEVGRYQALIAPRAAEYRRKADQLPSGRVGREIVQTIRDHFKHEPHLFERCAVELAKLMDSNIIDVELTRKSADGGRDAVGLYRIGPLSDAIKVDFALEAKCYAEDNSIGVREISRLISRLRHRQFGMLITTSFVAEQAYREVREDRHPVVIISAEDIVQILAGRGLNNPVSVKAWLQAEFGPQDL